MTLFRFKRIESTTYDISVHADTYGQAFAKVAVGHIESVASKEGVVVHSQDDHTEIVKCNNRMYAMAYVCDECETTWTNKYDYITGGNCPTCGAWNTPFSTKELTG